MLGTKQRMHGDHKRMPGSLIFDSVTVLPLEARGQAAIAASHGSDYAAYLAAKAGLKAVILCDAGVGRERAGIGGLSTSTGSGSRPPRSAIARRGSATAVIVMHVGWFLSPLWANNVGVTAGMAAGEALVRLEQADATTGARAAADARSAA